MARVLWHWSTAEPTHLMFLAVAILTGLRFVLAASLPLSFDEAYYWLWSKHLAAGYFEHPAAIALAIRAGVFVFGDTELGVRFIPLLASIVASWAVWRSAAILLSGQGAAATATLLFNCTLMVAAETMGATPDSLLIAAAALLLCAMAELESTQDGRWWLAVGGAAGMAIAAKYTGLFLCASVVIWLVADVFVRPAGKPPWLCTVWPYAGAAIVFALFVPTVYWNAVHAFVSFRFQFGRIEAGHPTARYLLEFLGCQMALASPGILLLAGMGLRHSLRASSSHRSLLFALAVLWLPLLYFTFHALHDRVQGNWPSFIYPALALLAAKGFFDCAKTGSRVVRGTAIAAACTILAVAYMQAFFGVIPIGRNDPVARMMGVGFSSIADSVARQAATTGAHAIVTTNYATTSWLRFYERSSLPIVQIADDRRFLSSPRANGDVLKGRLLYITQAPRRELPAVLDHFSDVIFLGTVERSRNNHVIEAFELFAISGFHGAPIGRVP